MLSILPARFWRGALQYRREVGCIVSSGPRADSRRECCQGMGKPSISMGFENRTTCCMPTYPPPPPPPASPFPEPFAHPPLDTRADSFPRERLPSRTRFLPPFTLRYKNRYAWKERERRINFSRDELCVYIYLFLLLLLCMYIYIYIRCLYSGSGSSFPLLPFVFDHRPSRFDGTLIGAKTSADASLKPPVNVTIIPIHSHCTPRSSSTMIITLRLM